MNNKINKILKLYRTNEDIKKLIDKAIYWESQYDKDEDEEKYDRFLNYFDQIGLDMFEWRKLKMMMKNEEVTKVPGIQTIAQKTDLFLKKLDKHDHDYAIISPIGETVGFADELPTGVFIISMYDNSFKIFGTIIRDGEGEIKLVK